MDKVRALRDKDHLGAALVLVDSREALAGGHLGPVDREISKEARVDPDREDPVDGVHQTVAGVHLDLWMAGDHLMMVGVHHRYDLNLSILLQRFLVI